MTALVGMKNALLLRFRTGAAGTVAECCFAGGPGQDSLDIGIGLIVVRQQGFGCLGALPFLLVESIGQRKKFLIAANFLVALK